MYSREIVFGDGMTEITAPPQNIEVFDINTRKRAQTPESGLQALSIREAMIIASCAAPVILGITFLTVMIRHTALYLVYWVAVWAWLGLVVYANTKARRRRSRTGARPCQKENHQNDHRYYTRKAARAQ